MASLSPGFMGEGFGITLLPAGQQRSRYGVRYLPSMYEAPGPIPGTAQTGTCL